MNFDLQLHFLLKQAEELLLIIRSLANLKVVRCKKKVIFFVYWFLFITLVFN